MNHPKNYIFLNGKIIPEKKAWVSCLSPGFLYSQGLFETMRSYDGYVFALDRHLERLFNSLPVVKIDLAYSKQRLKEAIYSLLKANNLTNTDGYVRLTVWQGEEKTNISIIAKKFKSYSKEKYQNGFKAVIAIDRINEQSRLSGIKSTNYLLNLLARKKAEKKSFDEAIFLNTKNKLAEGSRSNIFLVKKNKLFTPSLDSGCLPGITRAIVIELAQKNKIPVREKKILPKELFKSREAFLTSSLMEIMPLTKVGNIAINKGRIGNITQILQREYREKMKYRRGF